MNKQYFIKTVIIFVLSNFVLANNLFSQDLKKGPLNLEVKDSRYMLCIPDSILGLEIAVINRIAKGNSPVDAEEKRMYRGSDVNESLVCFTKNQEGKMILSAVTRYYRGTAKDGICYNPIQNVNEQPVLKTFEILKSGNDKYLSKIDVTDLLNADGDIFSISPYMKEYYKLEVLKPELSKLVRVERFENGMDIRLIRTHATKTSLRTFELNATLLVLPAKPMTPRLADYRVTAMVFNTVEFVDYGKNPFYDQKEMYAQRFHVKPKQRDVEKYLAGKLVEPEKPIVYWIDPTTPAKLIPYFMKGVNAWRKAFEQAGFKNAIRAELAPASDSTFNFVSARYHTVVYMPSMSYGGNANCFVDRRGGEVLTTQVTWPHGNIPFFRNQYMVQAGAIDTGARKAIFSDELIGELCVAVVSHEVGHNLGVHHNYLASSTFPTDSLRNKRWVEEHGISPSVMDYSRNNYVAQPGDNVGRAGIINKVGEYDRWAVEWLYRWYPSQNEFEERKLLDQLYKKRLAQNSRLAYLETGQMFNDVRIQWEDLGDDPILASEYGIKNLKRIIPNLVEWTKAMPGVYDYKTAGEVYSTALMQFDDYMKHVLKLIGGTKIEVNEINVTSNIAGVPLTIQKNAVNFLCSNLFTTQDWLLDNTLMTKNEHSLGTLNPSKRYRDIQIAILGPLLGAETFDKLLYQESLGLDSYRLDNLYTDLETGIFSELHDQKPITIFRRNLQKYYIETMGQLLVPQTSPYSVNPVMYDIASIARAHLKQISTDVTKKLNDVKDRPSRLHLIDMKERITILLTAADKIVPTK